MVLSDPTPRVEAEGEDRTGGSKHHQANQYKLHHLSVNLPSYKLAIVRIGMIFHKHKFWKQK